MRIPQSDDTENDDPWEYDTGEYREYRPLDFDYTPPRDDLNVVDTFDMDIDGALESETVAEEIEEEPDPPTTGASEADSLISEILYEVDGLHVLS